MLVRELARLPPPTQRLLPLLVAQDHGAPATRPPARRKRRPQALGAPLEESPLAQLNDPKSELSVLWDQEHDRYVLRRLLELVEPMFEPATLAAFRRVVFDEVPAAQVAEELGISVGAVYLAKSHVLKKLREEAAGLID